MTTPSGKMIFGKEGKPLKLTKGEAVAQALAFRPQRMAEESKEHWTYENIKRYYAQQRDELYDKYRMAKDGNARMKLMGKIQKYNQTAKKYGMTQITASSLRQSVKQRPDKRYLMQQNLMSK
jgi:hypothetical protein